MAIFRKRKIGFELKTDINRKLLVHCKLRNINILRDVFQKTCPFFSLFQLYIETCFLACLCLSSFAPRDVRGELFSDSEIARLRSCEIAREKTSTENYYRLRGRAVKCSHGWHGWRRRLPCLVGSSPTGDAIILNPQHEIARRAGQDVPGLAAA